jgi:hypothetical protein
MGAMGPRFFAAFHQLLMETKYEKAMGKSIIPLEKKTLGGATVYQSITSAVPNLREFTYIYYYYHYYYYLESHMSVQKILKYRNYLGSA